LGFLPPLHRPALLRLLRGAEAPTGDPRPGNRLVPPSWFRTTSTVFSGTGSRACCIPLPILGFAAFPVAWIPSPPKRPLDPERVPRDAHHTPRRIPLTSSVGAAETAHQTASPRPLPSCRYRPPLPCLAPRPLPVASFHTFTGGDPTSGPCSAGESVTPRHRFRRSTPSPSWASFPFEVSTARRPKTASHRPKRVRTSGGEPCPFRSRGGIGDRSRTTPTPKRRHPIDCTDTRPKPRRCIPESLRRFRRTAEAGTCRRSLSGGGVASSRRSADPADLLGVPDVKDRSEERLLGRTPDEPGVANP
jgi:hypothetical protein